MSGDRDEPGDLDALRVDISRLRAKLGDDAAEPSYIETARGLGYRLLAGEGRPRAVSSSSR